MHKDGNYLHTVVKPKPDVETKSNVNHCTSTPCRICAVIVAVQNGAIPSRFQSSV